MNCKKGDLAVIVRGNLVPENVGRIVFVESAYCGEWVDGFDYGSPDPGDWIVRAVGGPLVTKSPDGGLPVIMRVRCVYLDASLRPIRDQDGEDEILRIAGKPQEVTA